MSSNWMVDGAAFEAREARIEIAERDRQAWERFGEPVGMYCPGFAPSGKRCSQLDRHEGPCR